VNAGFEFADNGSRASTYQNTIDYDFRDPLFTRVERVRPTPTPPHNYVFGTSANFWSIVALRAPGDYDLNVYDNRDLSGLLASSTFSGNAMDFVAIDGNRRATGDYYPRINPFNGSTGEYGVEYVQGAQTVSDSSHSVFFIAGDVANVEDTFLTAGVPTSFRIVPSAGLDIEAFLVRSDSGNANSFVQGRGAAVRVSDVGGAGVRETLTYNESASQWDGLVVTNKSGTQGTYTVYRDTTAPTGSVTINNGLAKTNSATVSLNLPATDAQTGVMSMRVAFDGTLDSEPFIPYSSTRTGTLPGGDGTKTVAVQYRNNALMDSPIFKDTIVLDRRPNLVVTGVSKPPTTARRGTSFNLADFTRNAGPTATGRTTSNRYYLSTDGTKSSNDVLLTGARTVPNLAASTQNAGSRSVGIPASAATGQYFVITCADVGNLVPEFNEFDNCRASTARVQVTT